MIKCRDAAREIAVFSDREKTRLARAIWCIAEVEGPAMEPHWNWQLARATFDGSLISDDRRQRCSNPRRRAVVLSCTTTAAPLTSARGRRHPPLNKHATGERQKVGSRAPVIP